MRNTSKTLLLSLFTLSLFAVCQAPSALAQSRDSKLISARAGAVNLTSGVVEFKRKTGTRWEALTNTHDLRSGDTVRTGADGRAEVLLNPGSYLRAGSSTEFALVDASLDDLRLRLTRGAAVVEATGYSESDLSIVVATPQARVRIIRTGIYRLSVLPDGRTELAVQKGRAYVGEDEALLVKGGKVVRLGSSGAAEVAKFDKKQRDELDLWSRDRGKELAKANERVNRHEAGLLAMSSFGYDVRYGGGGFWYLNRSVGCYTFMPFYADWRSPYGFGYGRSIYGSPCGGCNGSGYPSYDSTPRQSYPSNGGNNNGGGYAGGGGGNNGGGGSSYPRPGNGGGNMGAPAPPPMPVQREINTERTIERNAVRTREP
jgi:uncharacterized membrane protein YgcG